MAEPFVRAQVSFYATLMDDGTLLMHESFSYREKAGDEPLHTTQWHNVEGTCDPQELAYTLWAEMEGHI